MNDCTVYVLLSLDLGKLDAEIVHVFFALISALGGILATIFSGLFLYLAKRSIKRRDDQIAKLVSESEELREELANTREEFLRADAAIRERIARCKCADPA